MNTEDNILKGHGLRITNMRKDILQVFTQEQMALTNQDIEKALEFPDRITIYRTLKKFEEHGIIHRVFDTSDTIKYALCTEGCNDGQHLDGHIHFECKVCKKTTCLDEFSIPPLNTPKGYIGENTEILIKGVCKTCNQGG